MTVESWAIGEIIHWAVGEMAAQAKVQDWSAVKASVGDKIKANVHSAWWAKQGVALVDQVIDMIALALQDDSTMEQAIKDLAAKDWTGAENELRAELLKLAPVALRDAIEPAT